MQDANKEPRSSDSPAKSQELESIAISSPVSLKVKAQHIGARDGMPEFSELVLACRHHLRLTVFLGALVSTVLVAVAWWLTGVTYEAKSLVQARQNPDVIFAKQTSRADFVRSQKEMVASPQVLAAALEKDKIQPLSHHLPTDDAVDWLKDLLSVDSKAGAEVMSISVLHPSPHVSQSLCIAVTRSYLQEVTKRTAEDWQIKHDKLERAALEADRRLDELWTELNQVAAKVGSDNTESLTIRDEIQLQAYREYSQQLRAAQMRGHELQRQLREERLRMASEQTTFDEATEEILQSRPDVVAARERIAKVDSQIQQIRAVAAREDSPRLTRIYEDREFLSASLDRLISDLRPQLREQAREKHRIKLESSQAQLQNQIELNQAEKEFLHGRMTEIDTTIVRTDEKNGVQLEMSRHAVDRQMRIADRLWQSLEEFRIDNQSRPSVTLLDLAQLPSQANHGKQMKAAAGAAGVGWMIVILCIGWFEFQGRRVRHSNDVKLHSARPVFGANDVSAKLRTKKTCFESGVREAAARFMLVNKSSKKIPSVMVSSASADEPRHLVSMELARAFQSFRRRTLLIDCDTSGSYLSRQLGADQLPGMLQVRPDQMNSHQYVVPSCEEGLDFMPLGRSGGESDWIDPEVFQWLLGSLRGDYDAIVVNGPAIMSSAESVLLASQVDQTLLAVFVGNSRWHQLAASERIAVQAGIAVFGSVLHSGNRSATLELKCDRQDVTRIPSDAGEATEESLRETVAAIRQDLNQTASANTEPQRKAATNKELTS